jgi:hypothetical protein
VIQQVFFEYFLASGMRMRSYIGTKMMIDTDKALKGSSWYL